MTRQRKPVTTIIIIMILFTLLAPVVMKAGFCSSNLRKIDVFTNKAPFDGKGTNKSSDSFQPQELVKLYALVTYNEAPVANKLVAFQINNQPNAFKNITIIGVNLTNNDGIASFHFRIPWPSENNEIIFGEWSVVATTDLDGEAIIDTLTFQVGWIIQITNMKTLNIKLETETTFRRGEKIIFELTIKNIAFTPKNAIIFVDAQDAANYPIVHEEKAYTFHPGESRIQILSEIPTTAAIGKATASATAFTHSPKHGGTPYCPPISSSINIIMPKKYYLTVKTDPPSIITIPGEGWYNEGEVIALTALDIVAFSDVARYRFSHWEVDGESWTGNPITLIMDKNHTAIAHYVIQYFLSVKTSPAQITVIPGEGWYDAYTNVTLMAPPVKEHDFEYWDIDGAPQTTGMYQIIICMDNPHTATAHYRRRIVEWLYLLLVIIVILVIILLSIFAYHRIKVKRRLQKETFYKGWTAWYYRYNLNLRD